MTSLGSSFLKCSILLCFQTLPPSHRSAQYDKGDQAGSGFHFVSKFAHASDHCWTFKSDRPGNQNNGDIFKTKEEATSSTIDGLLSYHFQFNWQDARWSHC